MLRSRFGSGLLVVLVAVSCFVGCSDDPTGDRRGDPNAAEFQGMKAAIAQAVDSTLAVAFHFAAKPNRYPSDVDYDWPQLGPQDSLLYNYVDGWHIFYLGLAASTDYSYTYTDSARYWEGASIVQYYIPARSDKLDLIRHQATTYTGTDDAYVDFGVYSSYTFHHNMQLNQSFGAVSKLTIDDHWVDQGEEQSAKYEFTISADQIEYAGQLGGTWRDMYATSGTLVITARQTVGEMQSLWDVSVDFDLEGTASVRADNGDMIYEYQLTPEFE